MNVIPQRVRDGFGKLIEPLAVVFIRLHIRPNLITTVGTLVVIASATAFGLGWVRPGGLLLLVSGVFDLLDGRVARRADMTTTFGAFYDSTLDRVGEAALFSGIAVYFLRGGVPAERLTLAVVACLVALAASLIVSYTRARAEGLGLTAKVGIAQRAERVLLLGAPTLFFGAGNRGMLLFWIVVVLALATGVTVVQRVLYVARMAGEPAVRRPPRPRDTLPGHAPAQGKLGVMLVGLGAVSTTFIAGVEHVRRGTGLPVGSLSQMGTIRLGKRTEKRSPKIKEFVPLSDLKDLVFTAWDPIPDDAYTAAVKAGVLERHEHLEPIKAFLQGIKPLPAVFDQYYVKRLQGTNVKRGKTKRELAEALRHDIRDFKQRSGAARLVMIWAASTEVFLTPGPAHQSLQAFERAMEQNDPAIAPSMLYAYAALMENVPFANGAPNLTVDVPALQHLAEERNLPIGGKDFKTGQTMMKTVLAPAFKARMLGLAGWYSTNILGNRDGEVLDDPESFKTKEESK